MLARSSSPLRRGLAASECRVPVSPSSGRNTNLPTRENPRRASCSPARRNAGTVVAPSLPSWRRDSAPQLLGLNSRPGDGLFTRQANGCSALAAPKCSLRPSSPKCRPRPLASPSRRGELRQSSFLPSPLPASSPVQILPASESRQKSVTTGRSQLPSATPDSAPSPAKTLQRCSLQCSSSPVTTARHSMKEAARTGLHAAPPPSTAWTSGGRRDSHVAQGLPLAVVGEIVATAAAASGTAAASGFSPHLGHLSISPAAVTQLSITAVAVAYGAYISDGLLRDQRTPKQPEALVFHGVDVTEYDIFRNPDVQRAIEYAAKAHQGQMRKTGDPYVSHCVHTARIAAALAPGQSERAVETVVVAVLHDVVDDTKTSIKDLEAEFGKEVARLVEGVSKLSNVNQLLRRHRRTTAEQQERENTGLSPEDVDSLRLMLIGMINDPRVVLVKLADRLHNMRTIYALPESKARAVAQETLAVWCSLASRLGVWAIKAELEDLCFAVLQPHIFRKIRGELATMWTSPEDWRSIRRNMRVRRYSRTAQPAPATPKFTPSSSFGSQSPILSTASAVAAEMMRDFSAFAAWKGEQDWDAEDRAVAESAASAADKNSYTVQDLVESVVPFHVLLNRAYRNSLSFWQPSRGLHTAAGQRSSEEGSADTIVGGQVLSGAGASAGSTPSAEDRAGANSDVLGRTVELNLRKSFAESLRAVHNISRKGTSEAGPVSPAHGDSEGPLREPRVKTRVMADAEVALAALRKCEEQLQRELFITMPYVPGMEISLSGRLKSIYSCHAKMRRKGVKLDNIYDARALRVVVGDGGGRYQEAAVEACYNLLNVVHRLWTPIGGEFDDYILNPKPSGYQSLHTAVVGPDGAPLEVQIRTQMMHEAAEFGHAAHWLYKEADPAPAAVATSPPARNAEAHEESPPEATGSQPRGAAGGALPLGLRETGVHEIRLKQAGTAAVLQSALVGPPVQSIESDEASEFGAGQPREGTDIAAVAYSGSGSGRTQYSEGQARSFQSERNEDSGSSSLGVGIQGKVSGGSQVPGQGSGSGEGEGGGDHSLVHRQSEAGVDTSSTGPSVPMKPGIRLPKDSENAVWLSPTIHTDPYKVLIPHLRPGQAAATAAPRGGEGEGDAACSGPQERRQDEGAMVWELSYASDGDGSSSDESTTRSAGAAAPSKPLVVHSLPGSSDKFVLEGHPALRVAEGRLMSSVVLKVENCGNALLVAVSFALRARESVVPSGSAPGKGGARGGGRRSARDKYGGYARLFDKVESMWWNAPGHGDWSTCLERFELCSDGIYHKVDRFGRVLPTFIQLLDMSRHDVAEYQQVLDAVRAGVDLELENELAEGSPGAESEGEEDGERTGSEAEDFDEVMGSNTLSGTVRGSQGAEEGKGQPDDPSLTLTARINNKVRLLRSMLQWEREVRHEAAPDGTVSSTSGAEAARGSVALSEVLVVRWPGGDIVRLPSGSSVDAFLQAECQRNRGFTGSDSVSEDYPAPSVVLVNGRPASLKRALRDGDLVEIRAAAEPAGL